MDNESAITPAFTAEGAPAGSARFRFQLRALPGTHVVRFKEQFSPASATADGQPGLHLVNEDLRAIRVQVAAGKTNDVGDIEYAEPAGVVSGIVFVDEEGDGKPDRNPRLSRAPVTLLNVRTRAETTVDTDRQGAFFFGGLPSGEYRLRFEPVLDAASYGLGKGVLRSSDLNQDVVLHVGPATSFDDVNYAYQMPGGDVRGVIFVDKDASGQRFGGEEGLGGVQVVLVGTDGRIVKQADTNAAGEYMLAGIAAGNYTLRFRDTFSSRDEEYSLTTVPEQRINVDSARTTIAEPTGYQPEVHEIVGEVEFEDGSKIGGLVVTLMDGDGKQVLDTAVTDEKGCYRFRNRRGDFKVVFPKDPYEGQLLTIGEVKVHSDSVARVPTTRYRYSAGVVGPIRTPATSGRTGPGIGATPDALSDIAAYMPTAHDLTGPVTRTSTAVSGPRSTGSLQQLVDSALTDVLGRRLKTDDAKAFVSSLERAFTAEETATGKTVYRWTPRAYAVQVDLGADIVGGQASFLHLTQLAVDDALTLLERVEPIIPDPDEVRIDALRSVIREGLGNLAEEAGREGGPRVARLDDLFDLLTDQLERLRIGLGFSGNRATTVEQERHLTDFETIIGHLVGLKSSWSSADGLRARLTGQGGAAGDKFLGTQFVLLQRAISVVAESVDEAYQAMDSVLLGPAERQTVLIDFPPLDGQAARTRMSVEDLLSWTQDAATDEWQELIRQGGRVGVAAIQPSARRLNQLMTAALAANVPHTGFTRERVRRAVSELALQLGEVERLAGEVLLSNERVTAAGRTGD